MHVLTASVFKIFRGGGKHAPNPLENLLVSPWQWSLRNQLSRLPLPKVGMDAHVPLDEDHCRHPPLIFFFFSHLRDIPIFLSPAVRLICITLITTVVLIHSHAGHNWDRIRTFQVQSSSFFAAATPTSKSTSTWNYLLLPAAVWCEKGLQITLAACETWFSSVNEFSL